MQQRKVVAMHTSYVSTCSFTESDHQVIFQKFFAINLILKRFLVGQSLNIAESSIHLLEALRLTLIFILTFSPDECQTKSLEKMNSTFSNFLI